MEAGRGQNEGGSVDWSWILFVVNAVVIALTWMVGSRCRWAWGALVFTNIPYVLYGLDTEQMPRYD
jgi:hypothetical protein